MIEDKKDGIKVAVNQEEADWTRIKENSVKRISEMKIAVEIENEIVRLADKKIKDLS